MGRIVAVLPVGAVEQHGPHLPVRVDAAINAGIVARPSTSCPRVAGNAAVADAARGREEVERAARALVRLVRAVADTPMDVVTQQTAFTPVRSR